MIGYTIRRLVQLIPVVFLGISLLFFLFYVLPGDPVTILAGGTSRAIPEETRQNIEEKYGFDKPVIEQFADYWKNIATGDLGESYRSDQSVWGIAKEVGPNSIRLAFWAVLIEVVIGISVGIVSAVKRYSVLDAMSTVATTIAMAVPVFVTGYLLIYVFAITAFQNDWPEFLRFPAGGTPRDWNLFFFPAGDQWRMLVLPALALAFVQTAVVARMTRTTMLETVNTDYIRTARAKGLAERTVVLKHGLRNALIPVVTLIGIDFGTLIGSAVLTETVFNWNGMGSYIVSAAQGRDAPVVLGLTLIIVIVYVLINLLVDLSYGVLDPRIRYD